VIFKRKFEAKCRTTSHALVALLILVNKCNMIILGFIGVEAFVAFFTLELVVIFRFQMQTDFLSVLHQQTVVNVIKLVFVVIYRCYDTQQNGLHDS
jgi:hypothetical protein